MKAQSKRDTSNEEREIFNLLNTEVTLRSKRELIEKFILENLPVIEDPEDITPAFESFWNEEQQKEFSKIIQEEHLSAERTEKLIEDYLFAERPPLRDEVLSLRKEGRPGILEAKEIGERILKRIVDFVETFINGMDLN